jgi:hypothetical protein
MTKVPFSVGNRLGAAEGEPTTALFVVTHGIVERHRLVKLLENGDSPNRNGTSDSRNRDDRRGGGHEDDGGGVVEQGADVVERVGEGEKLVAFGAMSCLEGKHSFATTTALSDGVAWRLESTALGACFNDPPVARAIAEGLCDEVFRMSEVYRLPLSLFEQPPQVVNVAAVSVAAAFEAYYRAAMNSFLNARLGRGNIDDREWQQ